MSDLLPDDQALARALERQILDGDAVLGCSCQVKIVCTMPVTQWLRISRFERRCSSHKRTPQVWDSNGNAGRVWMTEEGECIDLSLFQKIYQELVDRGYVVLRDIGDIRKRPGILSLEKEHYIYDDGYLRWVYDKEDGATLAKARKNK
jgi:hypothetical protein